MQEQLVEFKVELTMRYPVRHDPDTYDGAETLADCVDRERIWLQADDLEDGDQQGDGDYLIQAITNHWSVVTSGSGTEPATWSVTARPVGEPRDRV